MLGHGAWAGRLLSYPPPVVRLCRGRGQWTSGPRRRLCAREALLRTLLRALFSNSELRLTTPRGLVCGNES